MLRDDHAFELIEPWRPKWRQSIITALTTLPQGWVSTRKHQYTTAITTISLVPRPYQPQCGSLSVSRTGRRVWWLLSCFCVWFYLACE